MLLEYVYHFFVYLCQCVHIRNVKRKMSILNVLCQQRTTHLNNKSFTFRGKYSSITILIVEVFATELLVYFFKQQLTLLLMRYQYTSNIWNYSRFSVQIRPSNCRMMHFCIGELADDKLRSRFWLMSLDTTYSVIQSNWLKWVSIWRLRCKTDQCSKKHYRI